MLKKKKKAVFSPMYGFATFVKNQMSITVWVYFWSSVSSVIRDCFCASTMLFFAFFLVLGV
jgi:hypothetical protein